MLVAKYFEFEYSSKPPTLKTAQLKINLYEVNVLLDNDCCIRVY